MMLSSTGRATVLLLRHSEATRWLPHAQRFGEMWLERTRLTERIALGVVDADIPELLEDRLVFHPLCDGFQPHDVANAVDRFHHRLIDVIGREPSDEAAVDLQIVHR